MVRESRKAPSGESIDAESGPIPPASTMTREDSHEQNQREPDVVQRQPHLTIPSTLDHLALSSH